MVKPNLRPHPPHNGYSLSPFDSGTPSSVSCCVSGAVKLSPACASAASLYTGTVMCFVSCICARAKKGGGVS